MASIADVYVTVLPETGRIAAGIEKALRDADSDVREAAKRWRREIDRELGRPEVTVDADTDPAERDIERVEKGKYTAKVKVDVDQASLAKTRAALSGGGGGGLKPPGALGATAFGIFGGLSEVVTIAPAIVPAIGSIVQAVGQLSGVVGLLPAAGGAAALAIGSLKIATAGFDEALQSIRDPEKFAEALGNIAPNMQEAARGVQVLLPQIDRLKFTVQDAFGAGFGQQIQALGNTYLPMFQTFMSQIAGSANSALTGVSKMLQTPEMTADIKLFGSNATTAFHALSQALQPLVKAFADIAVVGSGFLPRIAQIVGDLATRFSEFIAGARDSGKLAGWIQGGIDAFTKLKDIGVNLVNILKGVFGAADDGGPGFLSTIENITQKMSDWVNSFAGQRTLTDLFDSGRAALEKWWPVLQDLAYTAGAAVNGIRDSMNILFPVIKDIAGFLREYPGLISAVVTAFVTWKSIAGVTALIGSLTGLKTLLAVDLGVAAKAGAATITSALGTIAIPATLAGILAGTAGQSILERGGNVATLSGDVGSPIDPSGGTRGGGIPTLQGDPQNTSTGGPLGRGRSRPKERDGQRSVLRPAPPPSVPTPAVSPWTTPPLPVTGGGSSGGGGTGGSKGTAPAMGEVEKIANAFGLTLTSGLRAGDQGSLHATGLAGDFSGNAENMLAFATYMATNYGVHLKELIYDHPQFSTTIKEGQVKGPFGAFYTQAQAGEHKSHVHVATAGLPSMPTPSSSSYGGGAWGSAGLTPSPVTAGSSQREIATYIYQAAVARGYSPDEATSIVAYALGESGLNPRASGGVQGGEEVVGLFQEKAGFSGGLSREERMDPMKNTQAYLNRLAEHPTGSINERLLATSVGGPMYTGGEGYMSKLKSQAEKLIDKTDYTGMPGYTRESPLYTEPATPESGGEQLAKDIVSGFAEIFGFGDLFKNPLEFGMFKGFKGVMGALFGGHAADPMSSLVPGGDGGSITDYMTGFIPGSGSGGLSGFIGGLSPAPPGVQNTVDQSVHMEGSQFGYREKEIMPAVDEYFMRNSRQPLRAVPTK